MNTLTDLAETAGIYHHGLIYAASYAFHTHPTMPTKGRVTIRADQTRTMIVNWHIITDQLFFNTPGPKNTIIDHFYDYDTTNGWGISGYATTSRDEAGYTLWHKRDGSNETTLTDTWTGQPCQYPGENLRMQELAYITQGFYTGYNHQHDHKLTLIREDTHP